MALYVVSDDNGFGSLTATAAEAITAGDLVAATGSTEITTTQTTSWASVFEVSKCDATTNMEEVVGIALSTVASGAVVSVATRGFFIMEADAAVTVGVRVQCAENTAPEEIGPLEDATTNAQHIGKALTGCSASGEYVLVRLNIS